MQKRIQAEISTDLGDGLPAVQSPGPVFNKPIIRTVIWVESCGDTDFATVHHHRSGKNPIPSGKRVPLGAVHHHDIRGTRDPNTELIGGITPQLTGQRTIQPAPLGLKAGVCLRKTGDLSALRFRVDTIRDYRIIIASIGVNP